MAEIIISHVQMPKTIDYSLEYNRRKSFDKLRKNEKLNGCAIKKLARIGFLAVENTNLIRCYYCNEEYDLHKDEKSIITHINDDDEKKSIIFHKMLNPYCLMNSDNLFSRSKPLKSFYSFYYEKERLDSFIDWPIKWLKPKDLAKNGFYYLRIIDRVRCAFCRITIDSWTETDDIMLTHVRLSNGQNHFCPFIMMMNKEDDFDFIKETLQEIYCDDKRNNNLLENIPINFSNEMVKFLCELENLPTTTFNNNEMAKFLYGQKYFIPQRYKDEFVKIDENDDKVVRYENLIDHHLYPIQAIRESLSDYPKRLSTFQNFWFKWPTERVNQTPEQFAKAGFFYTGIGDCVLCFHCLGGLKNWELDDDPLVEHAKYYPTCPFVLIEYFNNNYYQKKIEKTSPPLTININNLKKLLNIYKNNNKTQFKQLIQTFKENHRNVLNFQPRIINNNNNNEDYSNDAIFYNNNNNEKENLCKVCYINTAEVILYNCKHMSTCFSCFTTLYQKENYTCLHCPVCREEAVSFSIPYRV